MKILELTRAHTKMPIAFNTKHIIHIEPVRDAIMNKDYMGDGKTYVTTSENSEITVIEDYETIMRMLMTL